MPNLDNVPMVCLIRRIIAKEKLRLTKSKASIENRDMLIAWSNPRILKLLDMTIRSHILRHTCFMLLKRGGELPTEQVILHMQRFGYSSADTHYKFVNYINKINLRYDLPISFHYGDRYIRFDSSKM